MTDILIYDQNDDDLQDGQPEQQNNEDADDEQKDDFQYSMMPLT